MSQNNHSSEKTPADVRYLTRRAFAAFGLAALAGGGAWWWLRTRPADDDLPWPLRAMHRFNERLGRGLLSDRNLTREYPRERATTQPRANGVIGQPQEWPDTWLVTVESGESRALTIPKLLEGLPRVEMTTEFMCIEGWSQIVTWGGVCFRDAAEHHGWPTDKPYVSLQTADGDYMVGLDTASALHPQTLLCDSMNGEPLPRPHGGPLRLVIPVKYGIKNLKWLARIRFGDERPADYWAQRGYDWFAGL